MKIGAVLMASGFSRRFGTNKLLEKVDDVPMILRAFDALPRTLFERSAVVSAYPEILKLAEELGYVPIQNLRAEEGQSVSVRLGLSELLEMDGVLFAVCDQPWLKRKSVEKLLEQFCASPDYICALSWQGKHGNPVIFPAVFFPKLLVLTGDRGGGKIIRDYLHQVRLVEVESFRELQDVDTPADFT